MGKFAYLLVPALVLASACGTDTVPGSVSGTIHGQAFGIKDAVSAAVTVQTLAGPLHGAAIAMSSAADICSDATMNVGHMNEKVVVLFVTSVSGNSTTAPTATGTYAIYMSGSPPPLAATMSASVSDANCQAIANDGAKASTGSVTLTAISGNRFDGHFDVALDSGDHVTGSFNPTECPQLQTLVDSSGGANCI